MQHPVCTRRTALQAGASGILGLGLNHVHALRALAATGSSSPSGRAKTVIYIFLSGGLSQLDTFDLKPDAADGIRGEFKPIATNTAGIQICEHLPRLAQRSHLWSLVRSLTHPSNNHSQGHHIMLTGRTEKPAGFSDTESRPTDFPCIASVVGDATLPRNNLPPAAVLPEIFKHFSGRIIPGQLAGQMGPQRNPWFIEVSPYEPKAYGAYPDYEFDHQRRPYTPTRKRFLAPNLSLPEGVGSDRFSSRIDVLRHIDEQRHMLNGPTVGFDKYQQSAIALLTDPRVRQAFDLTGTDPKVLDRYGNNSFGWSLIMARRLVEAGVNLVQVNLGNNETWDNHGFIFPNLKTKLLPPLDRCLSALLDDLHDSGMLDDTLIVMAGEFGRTPKISTLPQFYAEPGRDHWGAVQTVFFAGGGTRGGRVVGKSDKTGGYPADDPQTPENMAATMYHALGIPSSLMWKDATDRPHHIYHGEPIKGLF
jgi:hypothetical protein